MSTSGSPFPADAYDAEYFLTSCDGYDAFRASGGRVLGRRMAVALELAGPLAGRRVLDLGCGRGEVFRHCSDLGARAVGLDFSPDALSLAREALGEAPTGALLRGDATQLPLADGSPDVVLALDLVEHLSPPQLARLYAEVHRVLAPGGRLVVHTMPNIWYYRAGYPLFRLVQRLRGVRLPRNPRDRWAAGALHVNEQSVLSLWRMLRVAGFRVTVYLRDAQDYTREPNPWVRRGMTLLARMQPFACVFCNDLFAVATKP